MKVSLIVPTRNGGKYRGGLIETLRGQTFRQVQILVVDSSSNDDTIKICRDFGADLIQINAKTFDHGGHEKCCCLRSER